MPVETYHVQLPVVLHLEVLSALEPAANGVVNRRSRTPGARTGSASPSR